MPEESPYANVVLIGFMGSGKTQTGRSLSERLGLRFTDTDALIETRAGKAIRRIFEEDGEEAFRVLERSVILEAAGETGQVIATGGGVPANPDNMVTLKRSGCVVWLQASPESVWERVREGQERPLLAVEDPQGRIRELLRIREPFYAQAHLAVDTSGKSVPEVAGEIIELLRAYHS